MFSILLNEAFLQPTSDKRRLLFIALAVVASALYQQAPKRAERKAQDKASITCNGAHMRRGAWLAARGY